MKLSLLPSKFVDFKSSCLGSFNGNSNQESRCSAFGVAIMRSWPFLRFNKKFFLQVVFGANELQVSRNGAEIFFRLPFS